jgi:predicted DNA-binding protein
MRTTTIRIDAETHARLQRLSKETGQTLIETVRDAAEALGRQHFAYRVANELASLRADTTSWKDYLAEADSTSVADGIG